MRPFRNFPPSISNRRERGSKGDRSECPGGSSGSVRSRSRGDNVVCRDPDAVRARGRPTTRRSGPPAGRRIVLTGALPGRKDRIWVQTRLTWDVRGAIGLVTTTVIVPDPVEADGLLSVRDGSVPMERQLAGARDRAHADAGSRHHVAERSLHAAGGAAVVGVLGLKGCGDDTGRHKAEEDAKGERGSSHGVLLSKFAAPRRERRPQDFRGGASESPSRVPEGFRIRSVD